MRAVQFSFHKPVGPVLSLLADKEGKTRGYGYGQGDTMVFGYDGGELVLREGWWAVKNDDGTFTSRQDDPYNEDGTLKKDEPPAAPEQQVVIHFANGSTESFDLSEFKRIEIPLSHGQNIWVERPKPVWYWNHEPAAEVHIMGGPQGRGIFAPENSNSQLLVAIPSTYPGKQEG